jgi:hypothetical protein
MVRYTAAATIIGGVRDLRNMRTETLREGRKVLIMEEVA